MASAGAVELPLNLESCWDGQGGEPFVIVDVFTETALEGNELGVFTDARGFDAVLMQKIARELNFAETIFILPPEQGGDLRIRLFTPRNELPFAGHPVLGAGFVAASALGGDVVRLETESGMVAVNVERKNGRVVFGRFGRPAPSWHPYEGEEELLAALGVEASLLPVEAYPNGPLHVYVALEDEDALAAVRPDFAALAELSKVGVNCFAGSGKRWTTRMFAPGMGIAEDPATGSAAGPLVMHLVRHGWVELGEEIEIHQGRQVERPSVLYARACGEGPSIDTVEVGGSAVIVAHGEYRCG